MIKESSDQLFLTDVLLQCFQRMTKCAVNGVGIIPVVSDKTKVLGPMHSEDCFLITCKMTLIVLHKLTLN